MSHDLFLAAKTAMAKAYANNPDLFARNYGSVLLGKDNTDFFL